MSSDPSLPRKPGWCVRQPRARGDRARGARGPESAEASREPIDRLRRSRARDLVFVLVGVLALVVKFRLNQTAGPLVRDYAGNVAASFAAFFVLKLPFVPAGLRLAVAAASALLATALFEATNGFGYMSNTQDPGDYLANALGVGLALGVEAILLLVARLRAKVVRSG